MTPDPATRSVRQSSAVVLSSRPLSRRAWLARTWGYRRVAAKLARADFQARYKRAIFGMAWAVGLPLLQSAVIAVVFSKLIGLGGRAGFAAYVLAGIAGWSYFSTVLDSGSTAIVDGSGLTDKVWFTRSILPTSSAMSNVPGLAATVIALLVLSVPLGGQLGLRTFMLIPAVALLILFAWSLSLVLAALHVYFRDVRFMVQAVILLWFYITPIAYPASALKTLGRYLPYNPMTGVVALFHMAVGGPDPMWQRSVLVTIIVTLALFLTSVEIYRRRDRLFVDLL